MPAHSVTHARVFLLPAACGLALSACATGKDIVPALAPRDIAALNPGAAIAAATVPGTAAVNRDRWWEAWGDPQLDTLIAAIGEGTPSIDSALSRLARASAELDVARSDRCTRTRSPGAADRPLFSIGRHSPPAHGSHRPRAATCARRHRAAQP